MYTVVHSCRYKLHALRLWVSKLREITIPLLTEDPIERALLNFLNGVYYLLWSVQQSLYLTPSVWIFIDRFFLIYERDVVGNL